MKKETRLIYHKTLLFVLSFLIVGLHGCSEKQQEEQHIKTEFNLETAKAEIEEANKSVMAFIANGDSIGMANAYTEDGKVMFAGAPPVVGRANIQTTFSRIINSGVTRINLETKEVFGTDELLAEEGQVTVYVKDVAVAEEKYIILWKKEDGQWKMFRDIANSNSKAE